jgi:MoxR-like ATPase
MSSSFPARPSPTFDQAVPAAQLKALIGSVSQAFIGKEDAATRVVLTLAAAGHVLIEDVPGVGKTLLAKAVARSISARFKRIQFTADLLPSDITGVTVLARDRHEFVFRRGPIFTNILLGDEINRATPRTQSALLEAMEELAVTVDGEPHTLDAPFFVLATQNPVELEGTYPLPFAQMDRFMVRVSIGYLDKDAERRLLREQQSDDPLESVKPVLDCAAVLRLQETVRNVRVEEALAGYIVDIIHATREDDAFEYGASPRGSLDVQRFAQAIALLAGRDYVLPDDIKQAARQVLPHRLITRKGTRSVSASAQTVIDHLLESVPVPL